MDDLTAGALVVLAILIGFAVAAFVLAASILVKRARRRRRRARRAAAKVGNKP